jgi:F-type H+-transporting ATPase subunit b
LNLDVILAATPVVDIDGTFFVQAGIFVVLVVILGPTLFRPWLEVQERRKTSIDGALAEAQRLQAEAEDLERRYQASLASANEDATLLRSQAHREEQARQAARVATEREQAASELDRTRARIAEQATRARAALLGRVDELAAQIVERLLRRSA